MKKYFGIITMSAGILILSVFMMSYEKTDAPTDEKVEYAEVSKFLRENVYTELDVLSPYNAKRSFSRCPSGFSHSLDEKQSGNVLAFGTIYNAEGCSRYPFCDYKVDMVELEVFLKNIEEDEYMAMDEYIEVEQEKKIARI